MEELKKYRGFMHIRCPHCGKIRTFCSRVEQTHYHCFECGHDVELEENLKIAWVNCQCGTRHKYFTNMTDKMFDIECVACGAPVAVEWNHKKKLYQTIKE